MLASLPRFFNEVIFTTCFPGSHKPGERVGPPRQAFLTSDLLVGVMYPVRKRFSVNVKDIFPFFPISSGKDRPAIFWSFFSCAPRSSPGPSPPGFCLTEFHRRNIFQRNGGVAQLVRACGSYPQRPGFESLHRHHFEPSSEVWGGGLTMKKMVVWATAGLFVLSLQGAALAQKEEKAPEINPPAMESPAPTTPMTPAETPAAPKKAKKTCKKKTSKKKTAKACKPKKKKAKTAKKVV
jgi:hypothetical protein